MSDGYIIAVQGLNSLPAEPLPRVAENAVKAINRTLERTRTGAARRMREQVGFAANYLSGSNGRLTITRKAQKGDLEGIITGRHRPTSLARFAVGGRVGRRAGARVMVKPGLATRLDKAFFVNLRSGNTDTKNNLGLAIRLPEGKRPSSAYKPTQLGKNLWLLYGPSVDQVFDDVATDMGPETLDFLEAEFLRLMGI